MGQQQYNRLEIEPRKQRRSVRLPVWLALGLVLVAAIVFTAHELISSQSDGNASASTRHSSHRSGPAVRQGHAGTTSSVADQRDPLTTARARAWIASRHGQVTAAVFDFKNGHEWVWNGRERTQTASIIKADILETLLYTHGGIPAADSDLAEDMIEESSDSAATELWDAIGGASGLAAYNARAGLTQTTPNTQGFWGETMTSAADQIKVLKQLAFKHSLLTRSERHDEVDLMHHIDAGQNWGVTGGVPAHVSVALKNGWVRLTSYTDWEINSIGWVDGDHHDYLIAVLTKHDPSEAYGIATIDRLSADIYRALSRP